MIYWPAILTAAAIVAAGLIFIAVAKVSSALADWKDYHD